MKMSLPRSLSFLALFIVFFASTEHALADKKSYIVYLGAHSNGPEVTPNDLARITNSHNEFLASFLGSKAKAEDAIFYSYNRYINGFAAILEDEDAAKIAKHPDVVSVFPNRARKLHTTHTWDLMKLEKNGEIPSNSLWEKAKYGEDVIIATLDTGVWPEAESFSEQGYGTVPSSWKGSCDNEPTTGVSCNRKLIGARYFNKGYIAGGGNVTDAINTARDYVGHGTHTLSTAAGNFVPGASLNGIANGTAKGGSPRARVAAYKVCWEPPIDGNECFDADILQAFDMAINDGVNVISMSVGGPPVNYSEDSIAIGSFHAVNNNIVVVCSAGNDGPTPASVSNLAPWIITVGASTIDRKVQSGLVLQNGVELQGASFSAPLPHRKLYPLISAAHAKMANATTEKAIICDKGTLDPKKVKGKIVICLWRDPFEYIVEKGRQAALAGAAGMIVCNSEDINDFSDPEVHFLPAVQIIYRDAQPLYEYMNSTKAPLGYIVPPETLLNAKPAPAIADFSSRGPNIVTLDILKPDITAPGVEVLAAYSEGVSVSEDKNDQRRVPFIFMSGTSMACPHVSGVVGLLKSLHPDWSPAAIRSAIMTTARTRDNTENSMLDHYTMSEATPFDYGAGHVRPNRAMDPGLVYDLTMEDQLNFLCACGYNQTMIRVVSGGSYKCPKNFSLKAFNYPSISVYKPQPGRKITVTRTLKNVGTPGTYAARVRQPVGISVSVEPEVLKFGKIGEEKSFKVTLKAKGPVRKEKFGELIWSDGHHYVRSPIVVVGKDSY